jgi:hypothetical protein
MTLGDLDREKIKRGLRIYHKTLDKWGVLLSTFYVESQKTQAIMARFDNGDTWASGLRNPDIEPLLDSSGEPVYVPDLLVEFV